MKRAEGKSESGMRQRRCGRIVLVMLMLLIGMYTLHADGEAATPGLPFTEDFSTDNLKDGPGTNAQWSSQERKVFMAWRLARQNAFVGVTGSDITADADNTFAIALGDVDGDGDLDVVVGNDGSANRLYLNNGTSDPFNGVSGTNITNDVDAYSIGLGDVDGDGDLDVVTGNYGRANRLYLNNGTADPFNGVSGKDITGDIRYTRSIGLGDVDGDGDLDVVVGNDGSANRLYLNNGTSDPFNGVSGTNITNDADNTYSIGLGDVDGDGDLDVVAGNNGANRLYLNNGTVDPFNGVSGMKITNDVFATYSIALGDVDGDGDLDVVAGNNGQANRLYLNNGTADPFNGVSGTDITSDVFYYTTAIALGDVDGDGDLDVVTGGQENRLYLNNGTADPFNGVSGTNITADVRDTRSIALGDVDGDGDLDMVAGNDGANRLYLNNVTSDPFNGVSGTDIASDARWTTAIEVGDVDGDGHLDVVAGNFGLRIRLYLNNGTADPFNGVSGKDISTDANNTNSIGLGDVDGDGDLDVVAGNEGQTNRLYLNNGTSDPFNGVSGTNITADVFNTISIALGDVDGDGDLDVVTGNWDGPNRLYISNGTADPFNGVSGKDITTDTSYTNSIALGDVDGDGHLDVVAGNWDGPNRLYISNGTADPFNGVSGKDITTDTSYTYSIALGDVDGDGHLDVVAGNWSGTNRLYISNGTADPFNGVSGKDITTDEQDTSAIALGDVDGDGHLDVVAGNIGKTNRLYLNNGTSDPFNGVSGTNITADVFNTYSIALGDVDGDGHLDVVEGNENYQRNRLYLNNGTSNPFNGVSGTNITADAHNTYSIALGDVDGDGDIDLVSGNYGQPNRLYLNNGTSVPFGGVSGTNITNDADATVAIALGDIDGDGHLDVVTGNYNQTIRLYLNNGTADPFNGVSGTNITADFRFTRAMALGDVDGDGHLDVVTGNINQASRLYLNNGTANPFNGVSGKDITADMYNTRAIALGDVDGDGHLDVVTGNIDQVSRLYLNNGTADPFNGVSGKDVTSDMYNTRAIALGDVDGDGHLDVVTGNYAQANRLHLNNGTADPFNGVSGTDITADADNTYSIALGDVDGDGDIDVAVGNNGVGQANRLYLNNGTADPFNGVSGMKITNDVFATYSIALGDVDGDGSLDVVAGNYGQANRLYRRELYDTGRGKVRSLTVDTEAGNIANAKLTRTATTPLNTGIDWYLTNNGGSKWFKVTPDEYFIFPTTGSDLRWKAELRSLSPHRTPVITQVGIVTDTTRPTASISYNPPGPYIKGDIVTITANFDGPLADSPVVQIAISAIAGGGALPATDMMKVTPTQYSYQYTVGDGNGTANVTLSTGKNLQGNEVQSAPTSGGSFTVQKTVQEITVTTHAPATARPDDTFGVAAASDSGLDVAVTTSGACSGGGTGSATITMTGGSATCYINFDQPGNDTYDSASQVTESTTLELNLTVIPSGTGSGSVTSANGIDCNWNGSVQEGSTCSITTGYDANSFDLTSFAGACSYFDTWTTLCSGNGSTCGVAMTEDRIVGAVFKPYSLVLVESPEGGHDTITAAYAGASGGLIYIQTHSFGEDLVLNRSVDVIFDIGRNCNFTQYSGNSSIRSLTVENGSVELKGDALVISP